MTFWRNNCWQETCFSYLEKRGWGSCFNSGFDMFHFVHCGHWPFFKPLAINQYMFFDHLVRSCIIINPLLSGSHHLEGKDIIQPNQILVASCLNKDCLLVNLFYPKPSVGKMRPPPSFRVQTASRSPWHHWLRVLW